MKTLVVILGATCVGKTKLSIGLAEKFKTEIINADSRQIYSELNIGTDKPNAEIMKGIPHHFLGSRSILAPVNAHEFSSLVLESLSKLFKKHKVIIMVGGSGLYIQSVCEGLSNIPKIPSRYKERLKVEYKTLGLAPLVQELAQKDVEYFRQVDRHNPHRIIRALEVIRATQQPFSNWRKQEPSKHPFRIVKIGLHLPREILYKKIEQRVEGMITCGLIGEVQNLKQYEHLSPLQTLGYPEIFLLLKGALTRKEAIELIKRNTRRFAKRQMTWFKRDKHTQWFYKNDVEQVYHYIQQSLKNRPHIL